MTTVTAPPASESKLGLWRSGTNYFLFRRLHSLTGILFGLYLVVHLLVNATLIEGVRHEGTGAILGPTVFQQQVDKIHSLPFLSMVEWGMIYLPLLYHIVFGVWITITGQPNVSRYGYGKNWAYVAQRISAIILVLFIAFHVFGMKGWLGTSLTFDPTKATQTTVNHMHANFLVGYFIYPIGILAATFHLANGFWTAAITWGLTVTAPSQKRWGYVCCGIFLLTFLSAMTALFAALKETPNYNLQNVENVRTAHG